MAKQSELKTWTNKPPRVEGTFWFFDPEAAACWAVTVYDAGAGHFEDKDGMDLREYPWEGRWWPIPIEPPPLPQNTNKVTPCPPAPPIKP